MQFKLSKFHYLALAITFASSSAFAGYYETAKISKTITPEEVNGTNGAGEIILSAVSRYVDYQDEQVEKEITVKDCSQSILTIPPSAWLIENRNNLKTDYFQLKKADKIKALAFLIDGIGSKTAEEIVNSDCFLSKPKTWSEFSAAIKSCGVEIENPNLALNVLEVFQKSNMEQLGVSKQAICRDVTKKVTGIVQKPYYDSLRDITHIVRIFINNQGKAKLLPFERENLEISIEPGRNYYLTFDIKIKNTSLINNYSYRVNYSKDPSWGNLTATTHVDLLGLARNRVTLNANQIPELRLLCDHSNMQARLGLTYPEILGDSGYIEASFHMFQGKGKKQITSGWDYAKFSQNDFAMGEKYPGQKMTNEIPSVSGGGLILIKSKLRIMNSPYFLDGVVKDSLGRWSTHEGCY